MRLPQKCFDETELQIVRWCWFALARWSGLLESSRMLHGTSWRIMAHHGTSWHIMAHHGTSWHCTQAIRSMPSHCLVSALAWTVLTGPARRLRITTGWSQQIKQAVAGRCYWTSLIVRVMRCLDQIGWQTTYAMMHVMFSVPQVVSKWPHGDTGVSFWCFFFFGWEQCIPPVLGVRDA